MSNLNITVTPGQVPVGRISLIVDEATAKVLEVECDTASPQLVAHNDKGTLYLVIGEHGISGVVRTEILFEGLGEGWRIEATPKRHSATVFLYQRNEGRELWAK